MKKIITLVAVMSIVNISFPVLAGKNLSVGDMNHYLDDCYQQTLLIEQKVNPENLSVFACKQVLKSNWLSKEREANTRLNLGLVYLYQDKQEKALVEFKRAVSAKPNLYQGHLALGKLLLSQKQYAESISHFDRALTINNADQMVVRKRALVVKLYNKSQTLLLSKNNSMSGNN